MLCGHIHEEWGNESRIGETLVRNLGPDGYRVGAVVDVEAIKQGARVGWGKGDYSGLAEMLAPAAQELCDACAVGAGQEVLDVAAGNGNFALACAFEGASVVASDIAPGMVEQGRARTEAEGYDVEWVEADAEDLPFDDGRFECVGSVFGAVIAPRPRGGGLGAVPGRAAREHRRAACVGAGRASAGRCSRSAGGSRRGGTRRRTTEWGVEETVSERFDGLRQHDRDGAPVAAVRGRLARGLRGADGAARADAGRRQGADAA